MVTRKEILHRYPFFRLVIPMILGILAGLFLTTTVQLPFPVIISLFILLWFLPFFSKALLSFKLRWVSGMVFFFLLFVLSYEITLFNTGKPTKKRCILGYPTRERICMADIVEPVVQKTASTKTILKIFAFWQKGKWQKANEKVLAYIQKEGISQKLFYGDRLIISCVLAEPEASVIPGSFDYKRFLNLRGIYLKTYIRKWHWRLIGYEGSNPVYHQALKWRKQLLDVLKRHEIAGREFGVASALLLGYVDEIDSDLMKDYAATGVLHILSVSGMHVGMIFLVLNNLLSFLDKRRFGQISKTLLSLLLIWFYALITGLSPAVLRAAVMLSLVIIGHSLKRCPDTLNILAASFFFLLTGDPRLLMDMGFQLSYLAVAGIVLLYKPIYDKIVFKNWILDKGWSLISVSIAAQLATTPLSMFYFHQFPNYFLLANIFVVPFSNLIIYTGILTLLLSGIPFVSMILAKLLSLSVAFLNGVIHSIGSLPGSVIHGIFMELHEMVFIYCMIILICLFIWLKQKKWLFLVFIFLVLLQCGFFLGKLTHYHGKQFFVYGVRNSALYDCVSSGSSIVIGDIRNLENQYFADNLKRSWGALKTNSKYKLLFLPGVRNDQTFKDAGFFFKKGRFFQFYQKRFGILHKKIPRGTIQKLKLDYLIISGNPKIKVADILRIYSVRMIIIDNSNYPWKAREWMKEARILKFKCYSVPATGPFVAVF